VIAHARAHQGYVEEAATMIMGQKRRYPPKMTHDHENASWGRGRLGENAQVEGVMAGRITSAAATTLGIRVEDPSRSIPATT
jgi:hypothetical protein